MSPLISRNHVKLIAMQAVFCALLVVMTGCGTRGIYPVRGQIVDRNGTPVAGLKGGSVAFASMDKKGESHGSIDEKGNFTLSTETPGDGAYAGKHRVTIMRPQSGGDVRTPAVIDPKYEDPATTDLLVTVEPRSNNLKLEVDLAKK
jgi:hypothetical protein